MQPTHLQDLDSMRNGLPRCWEVEEDYCQLLRTASVSEALTSLDIPHVTKAILAHVPMLQLDIVKLVVYELLAEAVSGVNRSD